MPTASRLVGVESVEVSRDDGDGDGQGEHPRDGARRPHQLAQRAHRDLVPVPHRRHRYDRPPEGIRDAGKRKEKTLKNNRKTRENFFVEKQNK